MNERIKQLAEQAWLPIADYYVQAVIGPRDIQKFAELIVKECAEQVDWILAEGGKTQGDLLREHFGVEE
jgi:hypothetical protein